MKQFRFDCIFVSFFFWSRQIVYMSLTQRFHLDHLQQVLDTAVKGCKDVGLILDQVVKKHLAKLGQSSQS